MLDDPRDFQNTYPAYPATFLPTSTASEPEYEPVFFKKYPSYKQSLLIKRIMTLKRATPFLRPMKLQWQWEDYTIIVFLALTGILIVIAGASIDFVGHLNDSPVQQNFMLPALEVLSASMYNAGILFLFVCPLAYLFFRWQAGRFVQVFGLVELIAAWVIIVYGSAANPLLIADKLQLSVLISGMATVVYMVIYHIIRIQHPVALPKD